MSRGDDERCAQLRNFVLQPINDTRKMIQPQFKEIWWFVHSNGEIELPGRRDYAHYAKAWARRGQTAHDRISGWALGRNEKAFAQRTWREYRTRDSLDRLAGPAPDWCAFSCRE